MQSNFKTIALAMAACLATTHAMAVDADTRAMARAMMVIPAERDGQARIDGAVQMIINPIAIR